MDRSNPARRWRKEKEEMDGVDEGQVVSSPNMKNIGWNMSMC